MFNFINKKNKQKLYTNQELAEEILNLTKLEEHLEEQAKNKRPTKFEKIKNDIKSIVNNKNINTDIYVSIETFIDNLSYTVYLEIQKVDNNIDIYLTKKSKGLMIDNDISKLNLNKDYMDIINKDEKIFIKFIDMWDEKFIKKIDYNLDIAISQEYKIKINDLRKKCNELIQYN